MKIKNLFRTMLIALVMTFANKISATTNADFKALTTQGCSPFIVLLFDSSTSNHTIVARKWVITDAVGDTVFQDNTNKTTIGTNLVDSGSYTISLYACNRLGECDYVEKSNYVRVKARPVIKFNFSTMGGCPPLNVNFACNSLSGCGTMDTVTIDYKNGIVETFPACGTYSTTYNNPGNYRPTIYVKNSCGCFADSTWTAPIVVAPKPVASFTALNNAQSCSAPHAVNFNAHAQNSNVKYKWYVNSIEQQFTTNQNYSYTFGVGTHNVMLVVVDTVTGCSDTLNRQNYVSVGQPSDAKFSANTKQGCAPLGVRLTNQTNGTPTNLKWIVTDDQNNVVVTRSGSPSLFNVLNHTFTAQGVYNVCLIATFAGGCADTSCTTAYITVGSPPNSNFTVDKTRHCIVPATSVATPDVNCPTCTYEWATTGLPAQTGSSLNATYTTYGNKSVSVTVTDAMGCSAVTTKNNHVRITELAAKLHKSGKGGCPPYIVTFADSTVSPDSIISVNWTFTGGSIPSATGKNPPAVTYATQGVYPVVMEVTTASGCAATIRDTIRVSNKPAGNFIVNPTTVCYEALPNLFDWNGSAFDTLIWHFGDGTVQSTLVDTVSYIYKDLGDFTPCLIASKDGCRSDSICMNPIKVNGPAANFTDSAHCSNRKQYYYTNKTVEATSYIWTFCDGSTSPFLNTSRLYTGCDTCDVKLTAFNSITGCVHEKTQRTTVICPNVDFTVSDTVGCPRFRPIFTNTSSSKTATRWDFNINNGYTYSNGAHTITTPNNTYNAAGYFGVSMINTDAKGCRDTITKPNLIKITSARARFTASDTVFCIPNQVNFTNTSTGGLSTIVQSVWTYGDGTPADSVVDGSHNYSTVGQYRVRLTAYNENGCSDTISKLITANQIVAAFAFDDSTCTGSINNFVNQSQGLNQLQNWYFPGGTPASATTRNAAVTYNTEGSYPVMLVIRDVTGTCRDTLRDTIHVYNPIANYSSSQKYASCPNPPFYVQFTDSSLNDVSFWEWDFGDGTPVSNQQSPNHYYSHAGFFPVKLTVRTNNGCTSTIIKDTIHVDGPFATMTFAPLPGICPCDSVEFNISTVGAVQAVLLDGQNSPFNFPPISPIGTFANPTVLNKKVQFCTSGTANAQVLISDGVGCNVLLQPVPVLIDTPSTNFTFTNNVCDSGSVCFTDNTMFFTPGTSGASWAWNFGDGSTDTTQNPCHVFTQPGDYNVTLTVFNNLGCSMSKTQVVHIHASPRVQIAANDSSGCVPQTIQFTNVSVIDSTTSIASLVWDFGNNASSSVASPSQAFNAAGNYTVTLTVTDSFGCSGIGTLPIAINALPTAVGSGDTTICAGSYAQLNGTGGVSCVWSPATGLSDPNSCQPFASPAADQQYTLTAMDANGCIGHDTVLVRVATVTASFNANAVCFPAATQFTFNGANTNGNIASYNYDLGDGNSATVASHSHAYAAAGTYSVRLIVTDNNGCSDDTIQNVGVRVKPLAIAKADTVCFGNATTLSDVSDLFGGITASRNWLIGSGAATSTDSATAFTYPAPGTYSAKLTVTNDAGCSDDTTVAVFVRSNPKANFTSTEVCAGAATDFTAAAVNGSGTIDKMAWDFDAANAGVNTSNNVGAAQFTYAAAGTYNAKLHVSDNFGCMHDTVKPVVVFSLPQALYSDSNACAGGTIAFFSNAIQGSNAITSHAWTFGTGTPAVSNAVNPTITVGSVAGNYPIQLIVADAKGCADTLTSNFRVNANPTAVFSIDDSTLCLNECVTVADASVAGDGAIVGYAWDMDSNGSVEYNVQSPACHKYTSANAKTITLVVTDANGCRATTSKGLMVNSIPQANFTAQAVCQGSPLVLLNQSAPGTGALTTCTWLYHDGNFSNNCNTSKIYNIAGNYPVSLVVADNFGCKDTFSQIVQVDAPTQVSINAGDTTICQGEVVVYNATGTFTELEWSPSTYINNPSSPSIAIRPSQSIRYVLEAKNGACAPARDTVRIDVIQQIPLEVTATPDKLLLGVNTNITAQVGGEIDSIIWSPAAGLDCNNCLTPTAAPQATTTYYATIYYSMNGVTCTQTDSAAITVFESCGESPIYVPNTFTPNGDGLNDGFTIRGSGISKVKSFRIFDRWGAMVFSTENAPVNSAAATWSGTTMNGKELNPGVFVYVYEIICMNNELLTGKGNITLIK
jgi:gliding motility-associated-like protein